MEDEGQKPSQPKLKTDENATFSSPADTPPQPLKQPVIAGQLRAEQSTPAFTQMGTGHSSVPSSFDMRNIVRNLPEYSHGEYSQAQPHSTFHSPSGPGAGMMYQYQGHTPAGASPSGFSMQYNQQMPVGAAQQKSFAGHHPNFPAASHQVYQNQMYYGPHQYIHNAPQQNMYSQYSQQVAGFGHPMSGGYLSRAGGPQGVPQLLVDAASGMPIYNQPETPVLRKSSSSSSLKTPSALRGPPRKPKQSGHALWVGNLPPGAQIVDLKDHFSRDATDDIESVFLISKSNCAFVNYKTEESCAAAMNRFHDSRFQGVRLVCRLRRGSSSIPAAAPLAATLAVGSDSAIDAAQDETTFVEERAIEEEVKDKAVKEQADKVVKEKYFVVKSLTVEDLERSVQSGIWATQSHNEDILNKAYKSAESVFLVFSANKSGEYFGYARMESGIDPEAAATIQVSTGASQPIPSRASTSTDVPLTIPTPATATAPRGHIIDDSARGTIFWEAQSESLSPQAISEGGAGESAETSGEELESRSPVTQQSTFGKPFKITWISTERLPFYRTRGLRNPWNSNREVKIARDGTELEPSIGRRLISMFSQQAQINAAARGAVQQQYNLAQQQMAYPGYGYSPQGPTSPYGRPF